MKIRVGYMEPWLFGTIEVTSEGNCSWVGRTHRWPAMRSMRYWATMRSRTYQAGRRRCCA